MRFAKNLMWNIVCLILFRQRLSVVKKELNE